MKIPIKNPQIQYGERIVCQNITQYFGENKAKYQSKLGIPGHNGIDFGGKYGSEIVAAHEGRISSLIWNGEHSTKGNGIYIENGSYMTVYWHLKGIHQDMLIGNKVREGQTLGYMGNSGWVFPEPNLENETTADDFLGTHLHFGLRLKKNGAILNFDNGFDGYIDPLPYFEELKKSMVSIIGNKETKEQYIKDNVGTLHRIANEETLNDIHNSGIINKETVLWLNPNEFSVYTIGKVWLVYEDK